MNKQYKVIFSETLKQYVVVSELVKGQGKGKGQKCRSVVASAVGTLALAGVMGLSTGFAYADTVVTAEGESASDATYTTGRNLQIKKTDSGGNVTYDLKLNNSVTLGDGTNTGTLTVKGTGSNQVVVEGGKVTASGTDPNQVVIDGTSGKITVKKKKSDDESEYPQTTIEGATITAGNSTSSIVLNGAAKTITGVSSINFGNYVQFGGGTVDSVTYDPIKVGFQDNGN